MTIQEFSDQFDVLYNNITSNQAPGLNEYEKSLFLTKAEKEIVKNYFTASSKGNNTGQGFDDSAKRQADFSVLMKTDGCSPVTISTEPDTAPMYICSYGTSQKKIKSDIYVHTAAGAVPTLSEDTTYTVTNSKTTISMVEYIVDNFPAASGTFTVINVTLDDLADTNKLDDRSFVYKYPSDVFIVVNESLKTEAGKYLQVIPLKYDEYTRLMSKPFKRPVKNQAWRLMNSGSVDATDGSATKYVEIITNIGDTISSYSIRYVRTPMPIVLANLDGLSIDGQSIASDKCELDPILHEDILQRAVELAKVAWTSTGQDNAQMVITAGQRSE